MTAEAPDCSNNLHLIVLPALPGWIESLSRGVIQTLPRLAQDGVPVVTCVELEAVVRRHEALWAAEAARALLEWPERPMRYLPRPALRLLHDEAEVEISAALMRLAEAIEHQQGTRLKRLRHLLAGPHSGRDPSWDPVQPEGLLGVLWRSSAVLDLPAGSRYALLQAAAGSLIELVGTALAFLERELSSTLSTDPNMPWPQAAADRLRWALPGGAPPSGVPLHRAGTLDSLRLRIQPQGEVVGPVIARSLRELDQMLRRVVDVPDRSFGPQDAGRVSNRVLARLPEIHAFARHETDRQIVEMIARLFEVICNDAQLPLPVRHSIEQLQLPVLRIALAEPRLLDSDRHPAWLLIDCIGRHTIGFTLADDPRLHRAVEGIDHVCTRLAAHERADARAFQAALDALTRIFRAELALELESRCADRQRLRREQKLERIQARQRRRTLARLIEVQQTEGVRVDPLLRNFLFAALPRAIAQLTLDETEQSLRLHALQAALDPLIDRIKGASTAKKADQLQRDLPILLEVLRQGCVEAGVPEPQREAVLECIRQAPPRLEGLAAEPADPPPGGASVDPPLASFFDLGHPLDEPHPKAASRAPRGWLQTLQPGDWCRLPVEGRWRVMRLVEAGDAGEPWLFSEALLDRCHAFTRRALDRMIRAGLAGPYDRRSLLERAVDGLLDESD